MAELINNELFSDTRGNLSVLNPKLPFDIKRVFFIFNVKSERGGHRHKTTRMAMICTSGKCTVHVNNEHSSSKYTLEGPKHYLLIEPEDWHTMDNFTEGATLAVFASTEYDPDDYIYDNYS